MLRHYAVPLSCKPVVLHYLHQESDNRFFIKEESVFCQWFIRRVFHLIKPVWHTRRFNWHERGLLKVLVSYILLVSSGQLSVCTYIK